VERLRYLDGMMTERTDSLFAEAADRIEALEQALAALTATVEALPGSVFFDMIDQEVFDKAVSLLTPSAAPERQ
jgi:hypothetical protein